MKKLFAFLLVICAMVLASCGGNGTVENEETSPETEAVKPKLVLAENGETKYTVVRPEEAKDWETAAAVSFRKYFKELTGIDINITTDWEKKDFDVSQRNPYEIIIGQTNREGSEYSLDTSDMGKRDFVVMTADNRIVIRALSEKGMNAALEYFFSEYCGTDINKKINAVSSLTLDAEINHREVVELKNFDIEDKTDLVGICYSAWFNPIVRDPDEEQYNITKILAGEQEWGGLYAFHYWGTPEIGYYRSDDKEVIRRHMTQLADAGIDYIIIDNTNANLGWKNAASGNSTYWDEMVDQPAAAILDTIVEMRAEGLTTPYVVMWCSTANDWDVVDAIYDKYFLDEKYEECWVYWSGLPFFLTTGTPDTDNPRVTWRMQWGLRASGNVEEWSFLQPNNTPNYGSDGEVEQMCVCVAMQQTYMSLTSTATGREGGRTFWKQWQNAFKYHPKCITVTWWNEWIAQRFEDNMFVDNYNEEYSRDIEPMEGGHGSEYYDWLCEYVRAYKAHGECPELHE